MTSIEERNKEVMRRIYDELFTDGRSVEHWAVRNTLGLVRQLGLIQ